MLLVVNIIIFCEMWQIERNFCICVNRFLIICRFVSLTVFLPVSNQTKTRGSLIHLHPESPFTENEELKLLTIKILILP